jgi:hypothetical protein
MHVLRVRQLAGRADDAADEFQRGERDKAHDEQGRAENPALRNSISRIAGQRESWILTRDPGVGHWALGFGGIRPKAEGPGPKPNVQCLMPSSPINPAVVDESAEAAVRLNHERLWRVAWVTRMRYAPY